MKNVTVVNGNYFKQAVELMNANELYSVKIQLGEELKDSTLKVFMENVEAVPVEKEEEIVEKIVEMYNFIFDDEYQIPEGIFEEETIVEEVKMEDGKETVTSIKVLPEEHLVIKRLDRIIEILEKIKQVSGRPLLNPCSDLMARLPTK